MTETVITDETATSALERLVLSMRELFELQEPGVCARLAGAFSLTAFELNIVLLCAAAEMQPQAFAEGEWPTFQLAMEQLEDAHWSAILPQSALRRWRLIEVAEAEVLMTARLALAEPVLHFLMGAPCLDERLCSVLNLVTPPTALPECYRATAVRVAEMLLGDATPQLTGTATGAKRSLAAAACAAIGLELYEVVPTRLAEGSIALLERDAALLGFVLLVTLEEPDAAASARFLERFAGKAIVLGDAPLQLRQGKIARVEVNRPGAADRLALWQYALGTDTSAFGDDVALVAARFALDAETILAAGADLRRSVQAGVAHAGRLLVEFCRGDARRALGAMAQQIEARAGWGDIVLPETGVEALRAIAAQVRQQGRVLDGWGFAGQTARGLGISALFHGASGTGKTLAAEVLAKELDADLFRIDLSRMVSKYIGETEKNLRAIFDAAEDTGAILLFDEADALFGKRSEVRDSHDRYANMEVSYLLQRVETYRGLAILTSNLKSAMDAAFLRRISFLVSFPFPDQGQRRAIWQRVFPTQMPAEGLDFDKLSRLGVPGGNIRSIALNAAYIAADRGEPVRMEHLLLASRRECAKLERPLSPAESGGWV